MLNNLKRFNLPELEEKVLEFWRANNIFQKSLALRSDEGKKFVFYEGPPYANGKPGLHHVLARVYKDIILRYKTMRGFSVPRRAGWDTHGLPVEMAAEKALGLKSKKDIEKFGIQKFNDEAKKAVWLYKDEWEKMTERIGYWLDLKNAYVTYAPEYIETLWWIIKQIAGRKLLYQGHKVVPWCTRCGTALSSHELAQGYKEVTDNSVYLKFKLKKNQKIGNFVTDDKTYILSWTTTPWTLPGNVALAVGESINYVLVQSNDEYYILAEKLAENILKTPFKIIKKMVGNNLIGLAYEPLFDVEALRSKNSYKIYSADFVTTDDGTGVVHTAVMYGEDDYKLGQEVDLPQHHTVNEDGKFTKDVHGLFGLYVKSKEAEEKIISQLTTHNLLLTTQAYTHEYPFCWRCESPVIYYARTSWFIAMSKLRQQLLTENKKINWIPENIKNGRFGEWLREVKDWNLSRERYWGTPLPIWMCPNGKSQAQNPPPTPRLRRASKSKTEEKCGHIEVVGSLADLNKLAGGSRNQYWTMRHGEAESNIFSIINDSQEKGGIGLTPRGEKQVAAAAKQLKAMAKKIDVIITSPVPRTRKTATIVAKELGVKKVLADKHLTEIRFGELAGQDVRKYHKIYPTYESKFEQRPKGGESLRDLRRRLWLFVQECEKKYRGKNILLVSHEYPIWMLEHIAQAWSEKRAITEKQNRGSDYVKTAQVSQLNLMVAPRNDDGEVDLHRPFVDKITPSCPRCDGKMNRVPEVMDVWFDSGAMPWASQTNPSSTTELTTGHGADYTRTDADKNSARSALSQRQSAVNLEYPADYICEGIDQTRGWFYTLLAVAVALGYSAPYKNVISLGLITDKFGQKMSKSKGNIIDPWEMIKKYGVDTIRWYFYTLNPPGEFKRVDENDIAKVMRGLFLMIYNSYNFLQTYDRSASGKPIKVLDEWIMARLSETTIGVTSHLDKYDVIGAARLIESFVDDLSRWYIRRSRKNVSPKVLQTIFLELSKLMAPFTPFFSESLYDSLRGPTRTGLRTDADKISVHLADWPEIPRKLASDQRESAALLEAMQEIRRLAALALAAREKAGIKVRQPLMTLKIQSTKFKIQNNKALLQLLADEINVKKVVISADLPAEASAQAGGGSPPDARLPDRQGRAGASGGKEEIELNTVITPELKAEGLIRELTRTIQGLRHDANLRPQDKINLYLELPETIRNVVNNNLAQLKKDVKAESIKFARGKFDVEINTKLDNQPFWVGIKKI